MTSHPPWGEDLLSRALQLITGHTYGTIAIAVVLTVAILLTDLVTPLGVTIWTLYLVPFLMLALAAPRTLGRALVAYIALIAVGLVFSPPSPLDLGVVLVNWGIFMVSLLLVAALLVLLLQQHERVTAGNEQRRRAEEALRTAHTKLQLLSSITRHDINNQLMVLNGHVGLLQMDAENPALEPRFEAIVTASERISSLIRFSAEYETIGADAPDWQNLGDLVRTAATDVPLGRVRLMNAIPPGAEVFADRLIGRVFFNLLDNAVRHGGIITYICFSVREDGNARAIVCEDDGDGVPFEEKEQIFDRGFGRNTGFGLFLSREILAISGIAIRETGTPGAGARFEIAVPAGEYRECPVPGVSPASEPDTESGGR